MKQYAVLIITVILSIAYTVTLAHETTVETSIDSSNTTEKNGEFEPRNKTFGERLQAAKSPVATTTDILWKTMVLPVVAQTEPIVSTTTEPLVTTKVESLITMAEKPLTIVKEQLVTTTTEPPVTTNVGSLLITTAEQQSTTEREQLVSTTTEPPVITYVNSLLITTAEQPLTTVKEQLVSTTNEPPVTTNVDSLITTAEQPFTTKVDQLAWTSTELPKPIVIVVNPNEKPLFNNTSDDIRQSEEPVTSTTESTMISTTEFNPCLKKIETPDFSAPERRISEQKCYEYIWNIQFRELNFNKTVECGRYEAAHSKEKHPLRAVIGGRVADPLEFPHMGALGWKAVEGDWLFKCGSSLISEKFLLTAAHCTFARKPDVTDPVPKIVKFGLIDLTQPDPYQHKNDYDIAKIIKHPKYHSPLQYFDIALIQLKTNVLFNANTHPACLWSSSDISSLGPDAFVTGWGALVIDFKFRSEYSTYSYNQKLQVATLQFIDSQQCDDLLEPHHNRRWCGLQDHQICAANLSGGVDACEGDSGGPLQVPIPLPDETNEKMNYIVGVTSFGKYCAHKNLPGIYSKVSSFIDWIEDVVWPQ